MLNEKVLHAIQEVRPSLQADGGDIELVSVSDDGIVNVNSLGHADCPMSTMTLKMGVENYLKKTVPEVKEVVQVLNSPSDLNRRRRRRPPRRCEGARLRAWGGRRARDPGPSFGGLPFC